jgi:altronate hydrolase
MDINLLETPSGIVPFQQVAIRLHPQDNVAIAKTNLTTNTTLLLETETQIKIPVRQFIPIGHKIALREIAAGQPLRRYGHIIGFAAQTIQPGQHVHTHNTAMKDFDRDYAFGAEAEGITYVPEKERRTFLGYRRANGQVGTRNYVAIISTVNCSAHACRQIAYHFTAERLAAYPNIDGVIALTHYSGCGGLQVGGLDHMMLQRTVAGMARHPNIGASILVGLGCEINQIVDLEERQNLDSHSRSLMIQEVGGLRKTIEAGIAAVEELLPVVNKTQRTPQPISELALALECGGSDSWSGVTANPLVGLVADEVVRHGGTVVLSETPEIYGAEHLLTRRAINAEVGQKLINKIHWWEDYTRRRDVELNNNPTPGNKAGGLTNIYEKSLGAVAKSGRTPLMDVYDYADRITSRGFVFMDSPGYDPVSVTGKVAGGCNMVLFTTGRGSVFGFKPAPSIKICTNSATYRRMSDDMDVDAGRVLQAGVAMEVVAAELLDMTIAVASGQPSKSEAQDVGEAEFVPWGPIGFV